MIPLLIKISFKIHIGYPNNIIYAKITLWIPLEYSILKVGTYWYEIICL